MTRKDDYEGCLFLSLTLLVMLSGAPAAGQISVGQMAPPLTFTQLLQAPSGTRTDWPSLRGKVVVLEFWATWCGACIEQIPHLNSIVRSVGSGKVQFIAVDDQSAETVQTFVARIPITSWLGIDTTGKTIHAYGGPLRKRTIEHAKSNSGLRHTVMSQEEFGFPTFIDSCIQEERKSRRTCLTLRFSVTSCAQRRIA